VSFLTAALLIDGVKKTYKAEIKRRGQDFI